MIPAIPAPHPARRLLAWGLVGLMLLVSLVISQRGYLMLVQDGHTAAQAGVSADASHHGDPAEPRPHNHAEHCPLCFSYWVTGDFAGDWGGVYSPLVLKKLWLEATVARQEFLQSVAARGPPGA